MASKVGGVSTEGVLDIEEEDFVVGDGYIELLYRQTEEAVTDAILAAARMVEPVDDGDFQEAIANISKARKDSSGAFVNLRDVNSLLRESRNKNELSVYIQRITSMAAANDSLCESLVSYVSQKYKEDLPTE